ncbi:MAG: hypothetical protein BWZ02_02282 [Lentisphaerae bacterium ADurb.BinA184]|nr:MAG: hypothetical protein BWZ02_02282 [Lentisphaerae bacterium ADurb.BinA184]
MGLADLHPVVLDFTRPAGARRPEALQLAQPETDVGGAEGGAGRHRETKRERAAAYRGADHDVLARVVPVAVGVEIHPRVKEGGEAGRGRHGDLEGGVGPRRKRLYEDDPVLVINRGQVVAAGRSVRLSVGLVVNPLAQQQPGLDGVLRAIVGRQCRVAGGRRPVGRIAEVHPFADADAHGVVLDLAVGGRTGHAQVIAADAETGVGEDAGRGADGRVDGVVVGAGGRVHGVDDVFVGLVPVAVAVEVDPTVEMRRIVHRAGKGAEDLDRDRLAGAGKQGVGQGDAVPVVEIHAVVARGRGAGLAVGLGVNQLAQPQGRGDGVDWAVAVPPGRVGPVRGIAAVRLTGPLAHVDDVVLNLAVAGLAAGRQPAGPAEPETAGQIPPRDNILRNPEAQGVDAGIDRHREEDLLARVVPVAVVVEVNPGVQLGGGHVGRQRDHGFEFAQVPRAGQGGEEDAVLVVRHRQVVAEGEGVRLAVEVGVVDGAEAEPTEDDVAGAVVGGQRRVARGVGRIHGVAVVIALLLGQRRAPQGQGVDRFGERLFEVRERVAGQVRGVDHAGVAPAGLVNPLGERVVGMHGKEQGQHAVVVFTVGQPGELEGADVGFLDVLGLQIVIQPKVRVREYDGDGRARRRRQVDHPRIQPARRLVIRGEIPERGGPRGCDDVQRVHVVVAGVAVVGVGGEDAAHGHLVGQRGRRRRQAGAVGGGRRKGGGQQLVVLPGPATDVAGDRGDSHRDVVLWPRRRPVVIIREHQVAGGEDAVAGVLRDGKVQDRRQDVGQVEVELVVSVNVEVLRVVVGAALADGHRGGRGDGKVGRRWEGVFSEDGFVVLEPVEAARRRSLPGVVAPPVDVARIEALIAVGVRVAELAVGADVHRELKSEDGRRRGQAHDVILDFAVRGRPLGVGGLEVAA